MGIQNRAEEEVDDVFYTPAEIAVMMVEMAELKPDDIVLEPCRGGGMIYKLIPDYCTKEWCEVAEGRDFFEYTGHVMPVYLTRTVHIRVDALRYCRIRHTYFIWRLVRVCQDIYSFSIVIP